MFKKFILIFIRIILFLFPDKKKRDICLLFFLLLSFKIFWFNYSWCSISTFRPFSFPETYIFGILSALILIFPVILFRSVWVMWVIDVLLGVLLLSNLIYFRTYYTAIPLSSYALFGNMEDFTSSIYGSFRFEDILFPLSTIVAVFFYLKSIIYKKDNIQESSQAVLPESSEKMSQEIPSEVLREASSGTIVKMALLGRYALLIAVFVLIAGITLFSKGGFKKAYESLQDSYTHTCGTPMYTVLGSICYDYIRDKEYYTPEVGQHIEAWMSVHKNYTSPPPLNRFILDDNHVLYDSAALKLTPQQKISQYYRHTNSPMSCIIILAESLESWVLEQTVEDQEIMPEMNHLLRDSTTLYAPYVLSQVKGGRSVDAQLMFNTGLLPIDIGTYSLKYPNTLYHSLAIAMKEKHGHSVKAYTLTADKPMVWNQSVILPQFGYDSLISKKGFIQDEKVGPHYRHQLGDVSLLRQCVDKIKRNEVWGNEVNMLQIVTYSGHFPFTIPDDIKNISFSDNIPEVMRDYMTTANYTDRALGVFVNALKSDPAYNNTLIIIVGDHEGLIDMRDEFYNSDAGRGIVSESPFVPLIIANIPDPLRSILCGADIFETSSDTMCSDKATDCLRYNKVMGQIDIYPTLLDLLNLADYQWGGLGYSILNQEKPYVAIDPYGRVYGDTTGVSDKMIRHLDDAWNVSDEIIRYNYFKRGLY